MANRNRNRDRIRRERLAAQRLEQERRRRRRRLGSVAGLVAVLALVIGGGYLLTERRSVTSVAPPPRGLRVVAASPPSLIVGNDPETPVKVVVYEDFLCPFCQAFENASRGFLRRDAEQGKVLVDYRPFQLLDDDYSKRALNAWSVVQHDATPRQTLLFHDLLYENQPYESSAHKPSNGELKKLARKAGVTSQKTLEAFDTEHTRMYDAEMKAARDAGVRGTPTVLVNGELVPSANVDQIVNALKQAVAGS